MYDSEGYKEALSFSFSGFRRKLQLIPGYG
jgi:hypothetical protein